jgi:hypothetical protein
MRWMLGVVGVVVAMGLVAPQAARAATCPAITLRLAGTPTRVAIHTRHVTCAQARRMVGTYLRRATPRACETGGMHCVLSIGRGWACSYFSAGRAQMNGGALLGCARSKSTRFTVVPVQESLGERSRR